MTSIQLDRAIGSVLASAAGDALGSQYEFGPSLADDVTPRFGEGVFGHATGEWTDDTSMAIPILDVLARGEIIDTSTREEIARRWIEWSRTAKDVGAQTRAVLSSVPREFSEVDVRDAARHVHERTGRSAGNGALMRTGPVALGYLNRPAEDLAEAARALSELTHWESDSASACILWSAAIRHAILTGELDMHAHLALLAPADSTRWGVLIDEALGAHPREFMQSNGWVVRAFQGALAAISGATSLVDAVERAVRGGGDTDTVAAIAGSLAGALWGGSAVPLGWKRRLHGWPECAAGDLVRQAALAARGGKPDAEGWPGADRLAQAGYSTQGTLARHPHDDGVWIGSLGALDRLPDEVDAVVSLCRVGAKQVPEDRVSVEVWLIDQPDRNPNLDFVLAEASDAVASLRAEGRRVFLHCAEGRSRTAAVAALYGARHRGIPVSTAWTDVRGVMPRFAPQEFLRDAVARIVDHRQPEEA
ncbi:ADP-ribosylglycohydrolase family protein [Microbacterium sp. Bi121]|uniref:ADP-ribosylglycohydrolase family protein n=1 Tax=Microbacterium sp. Bi121 TaxID=2822348 RepID=UPI001E4F48C6|nr:ADP-ribosylglycohydrolase family protein [Microbacterium sp. Bi121]